MLFLFQTTAAYGMKYIPTYPPFFSAYKFYWPKLYHQEIKQMLICMTQAPFSPLELLNTVCDRI